MVLERESPPFTAKNFPLRMDLFSDRQWGDGVLRANQIPLTIQGIDVMISISTGFVTFETIMEDMVSLTPPENAEGSRPQPHDPEFREKALEYVLGSLEWNGMIGKVNSRRNGHESYTITPTGHEAMQQAREAFSFYRPYPVTRNVLEEFRVQYNRLARRKNHRNR